jgi:hypothetical protein
VDAAAGEPARIGSALSGRAETVTSADCDVGLPDGSQCGGRAVTGRYCELHQAIADRDLQIFGVLTEHFRQDLREFWLRQNFYLVVNAALASVFVSSHRRPLHIVLASLGLILALFWFQVARGSLKWLRLWRNEVRRVDEIVNRFRSWHTIEANAAAKPWDSPSWVTQWLPVVFIGGWVTLITLSSTSVL